MKSALLIHGTCDKEEYFSDQYPSLSNSHWFPWLQKQLLINGIATQTPEMPEAYQPDYEKWAHEFERYAVDENTLLVGHSCGGGFLVRWLSEHATRAGKLVLVAPWLDPNRTKTVSFFDFSIDSALASRTNGVHLLVSPNDAADIHTSVAALTAALPEVHVHQLSTMGHFTTEDMGRTDFPELLELIVNNSQPG